MIDDKELNEKICFNTLVAERLVRLSSDERRKVVRHLIDTSELSERQIAKRLGVAHTTFNGWKTGKVKDKNGDYLSLDIIINKLSRFEPNSKEEFDKITKIYEIIKAMLQ